MSGCSAPEATSSKEAPGTLIVYTNSNSDGRGEWITEKAAEAGFAIEIVGLGGADLANRIVAEKNNPVGDVVFGLNNMFFETLKAEETITAYKPSWASEVDANAGDPMDGAFWPLVEQAIVTVYDTNKVAASAVPNDVAQLHSEAKYSGRYEVNPSLGQATPQLVLSGIVANYASRSGDLGVSDTGWKEVADYYANGSPAVEGTDLYARIARGEVDYGVLPSSGITSRDAEYGTATGIVPQSDGYAYVTEQIALVAGGKRPTQSQKFIDWFGSADVQGQFAQQFAAYPVNEGARAAALPAVVELIESLPRQDIDYAAVREHIGEWVEKTELEYLP
ncbi:MAG: extracellular solute-binding protein [Cryobacterium sp.]|uniref:extracellular solute-binding protein n=1 Tax=unclassified Cryobacterium TaxID=2649013 RepID=UPI001A1DC588|nr:MULTISPECIES: extracellular solute-binding protein [unclassified Cryobacterium]MCY7403658.1 extracellular solute-binding protein [Cryobacterium sp.]